MKTKRTPGPWKSGMGYDPHDRGNTFYVAPVKVEDVLFIATCLTEANARLIAAAPEMLDALEEASKLLAQISTKTGMSFFSVGGMIDDVIRKARGDV